MTKFSTPYDIERDGRIELKDKITMSDKDKLIIGNRRFEIDDRKSRLNANVLIIGSPGTGKTRNIIIPNLLRGANSSFIVSDPKGVLYQEFHQELRDRGYRIQLIDLRNPQNSTSHYNPFHYIKSDEDCLKLAHWINGNCSIQSDPFWDNSAEMLLSSIISYIFHYTEKDVQTMKSVIKLLSLADIDENNMSNKPALDRLFEKLDDDEFCVKQYFMFRSGSGRTLRSIIITLLTKLRVMTLPEIEKIMQNDSLNLDILCQSKTILFLCIPDTDRSKDTLANLFFSQVIDELCNVANNQKNGRLAIPVTLILDDFASSLTLPDFPVYISTLRSRGISCMVCIQSLSQLESLYKNDSNTIVMGCDTICYMGGNDIETAKNISIRADIPVKNVLTLPIDCMWIFRRGDQPVYINRNSVHEKKRLGF